MLAVKNSSVRLAAAGVGVKSRGSLSRIAGVVRDVPGFRLGGLKIQQVEATGFIAYFDVLGYPAQSASVFLVVEDKRLAGFHLGVAIQN